MTATPKICAIIVIFQPPKGLNPLLNAISPQVQEVVIVDNGNNTPIDSTHWIDNPENGLAKAQNLGLAKTRELGCSHLLLLDDDSLPAPNMVEKLLEGQQLALEQGLNPAIIGPNIEEVGLAQSKYIQPKGKCGFKRVSFSENTPILSDLFYVAASGSLIALEVFDKIGELREEFFIYYIDTEFALRARKAGYEVIAVRDAKMQHHFGTRSYHSLFGLRFTTTNHSATARYYMFRNRKYLWGKYSLSEPGYLLFDLLRAGSEILRVLLFEKQKIAKVMAMMSGLFDVSTR